MKYQDKLRARRMETESGRIAQAIEDLRKKPFKERMEALEKTMAFPGYEIIDGVFMESSSDRLATYFWKRNSVSRHDQLKVIPDTRMIQFIDDIEFALDGQLWITI